PDDFFEYWFRDDGKPYFFLFKNNLRVTNIQFGELISLLKVHLITTEQITSLRFLSYAEFRWIMNRLNETFDLTSQASREYVATHYVEQFNQTIVLDTFFCSCAVYLPPLLDINLQRICAESGYIHSCGVNLLTKLMYHTRTDDLNRALKRFIDCRKDNRLRF